MRLPFQALLLTALFVGWVPDGLAAGCANEGGFNRYVRLSAQERQQPDYRDPFFVLEVSCESGRREVRSAYADSEASVKPSSEQNGQFTFRYPSGLTSDVQIREKMLGDLVYREATVQIRNGAKPVVRFRAHGHRFFNKDRPACYSEAFDGGFVDEVIRVKYPRSKAAALLGRANHYGWAATQGGRYDEQSGKPIFKRNDRLFDSPASCKAGACEVQVYVGYGREFFAINQFNALDASVCAIRENGEAGGPPLQVAGIPLDTLTNHNSPLTTGTREALRTKVLPKLFGAGASTTELADSGQGKTFLFSVVGPNRDLRVTAKSGYWYKSNISLRVGVDTDSGDLGEKVELTILDLVEIRAPETLATLPAGTIAAGRTLEYLSSAGISADGRIIRSWTQLLATRIADATGGFVEGS